MSLLDEVFAPLEKYADAVPLDVLRDWMESCELTYDQLKAYVRFSAERYMRNSFKEGPAYQALLLCWSNGQRSPIHDHLGSSCAVKVLRGVATETTFDFAPNGMVLPVSSRELPEGSKTASYDKDVHQVSNLQSNDANLITMHVYSPPLLSMNMYNLDDASVSAYDDPINYEFLAGAGI